MGRGWKCAWGMARQYGGEPSEEVALPWATALLLLALELAGCRKMGTKEEEGVLDCSLLLDRFLSEGFLRERSTVLDLDRGLPIFGAAPPPPPPARPTKDMAWACGERRLSCLLSKKTGEGLPELLAEEGRLPLGQAPERKDLSRKGLELL